MKIVLGLLLGLLLVNYVCAAPIVIDTSTDEFTQIISQSKTEHKDIFVYFTATWCPSCRQLENNVFSQPDIKKSLEKFVVVKIDVDRRISLYNILKKIFSNKSNTNSIPIYFIMDSDKTILEWDVGYKDLEDMKKWFSDYEVKKFNKSYLEYIDKNPLDKEKK
jgi:thiol-disulfide isomerase/thioredoxin